jgi:hypothetical protein
MQPERLATSSKCDGDRRSLYEKSAERKQYFYMLITEQQFRWSPYASTAYKL